VIALLMIIMQTLHLVIALASIICKSLLISLLDVCAAGPGPYNTNVFHNAFIQWSIKMKISSIVADEILLLLGLQVLCCSCCCCCSCSCCLFQSYYMLPSSLSTQLYATLWKIISKLRTSWQIPVAELVI
jgi:hypothetical protein